MRTTLLLSLAGLALFSVPAAAQNIRAQDPESIAAALRENGYAATLSTDSVGDPMITSDNPAGKFAVLFFNCANHQACATIQFYSGYTLDSNPTLDTINAWNRSQRFGRAYLDKVGDPILVMDVDLDDGGVSKALFQDNLQFWSSVVPAFEKHIGYRK